MTGAIPDENFLRGDDAELCMAAESESSFE